jgi:hypothetical protein
MNVRKLFLVLASVIGVGGGFGVSQSQAQITGQGTSRDEERACELALKKNTIVAIEEFLRRYPLGDRPSACGALAFNALQDFTSGSSVVYQNGRGGGSGGYGT